MTTLQNGIPLALYIYLSTRLGNPVKINRPQTTRGMTELYLRGNLCCFHTPCHAVHLCYRTHLRYSTQVMPSAAIPPPTFAPPWYLQQGLAMTLYASLWSSQHWQASLQDPQPPYQELIFRGAHDVPIFAWMAVPPGARATIIGTYGITGTLDNQWFLQILGRKAYARGYAVVLFDWRAHGQTAQLSPALTSDGLYEGPDFVHIAQHAQQLGCPSPFWFTGYSLGGQLALWGIQAAQTMDMTIADEIGGGAVICPNLDANRSLTYLVQQPLGRYIERAIARNLKALAWEIDQAHPGALDPAAIERANSIRGFDQELVIGPLGFESVQAYYEASCPLRFLSDLQRPTLILYAADDPLFDPDVIIDLQTLCAHNDQLTLWLTRQGGHVGYVAGLQSQRHHQDPDPWWAWNRILEWWDTQMPNLAQI